MNKKVLLVDQIAKINYKYTFSLAKELINEGIDVQLILDMKENDECDCNSLNIFITAEKNVSKIKKLLNLIKCYKLILKKIKKEKINCLHIQWINFSPVEYFLLKKISKRTKIVMTIHDILPFNEKKYDKTFYKKIYTLCDELIIQAETNMVRFGELFPTLKYKAHYIPHGHFLNYAEIIDTTLARKNLGISNDKFVFLFFGQIKKVKGVDLLLQAFAELQKKYKDVYLVVAGKMWKEEIELYDEIISNNSNLNTETLKMDVRFIPDEEICYYYSAANVCVLPYKDLYQSGVVQLVYAYKKCAIVSNLPAFMEVVNNHTGYIFENNNIQSLFLEMEKAYLDKKNNSEKGQNGYDLIKSKFDWSKIAKETIVLY